MDEQLKSNLTSSKHWGRLMYMIVFLLFVYVAAFIMWAVIGVQFLFALITGNDNDKLRSFGDSLSTYIFQALQFLSYNSEEKPFPFAEWPAPQAKAAKGEVLLASEAEADEAETATAAVDEAPKKRSAKPKAATETEATEDTVA